MSGTNSNFTANLISQQLALRSNQLSIRQSGGGYQVVDQTTGQVIPSQSILSSLLTLPPRQTDPKISAQALNLATGLYGNGLVPSELISGLASVAAYVSSTTGTPIGQLLGTNGVSLKLINAYNSFKEKGSQVGIYTNINTPSWKNNPTLMGTISAAINQS